MAETVEQCYARIRAHGLTLKQQSAVDLLVAGNNDTKTAELLGVARTTVSKWRLYDPAFQAALQARRADVWGSSLDQLRSLIPKAIARIAQQLDHKLYSYEAAMALLRLIKIPSLVPTGPSSAEQVIEDLTTERMMARRHACMEDLGKLPGRKEDSPPPAFEREDTRSEVLGVLAQRLSDVVPGKSDPWEAGMKEQVPPAPAAGNAKERPATPVVPEPASRTAEVAATPAGNRMERPATPYAPEPACPAGEGIMPAAEGQPMQAGNRMQHSATPCAVEPGSPAEEGLRVHGNAPCQPRKWQPMQAGNRMQHPATPCAVEPGSPAGEGIMPAAEVAADPAGNRMQHPATHVTPEPEAVVELKAGKLAEPESTLARQVSNLPHAGQAGLRRNAGSCQSGKDR